jgi:hypothetical protein
MDEDTTPEGAAAPGPEADDDPDGERRRAGEDRRKLIDLVRAEAGEPERRDLGKERRNGDS